MSRDESTFDFDFGDESSKKEVTEEIKKETFVSYVAGPEGHKTSQHNYGGQLKVLHFKCVADKDFLKESKFVLCRLPQSQVRFLGFLSKIYGNINNFVVGWSDFKTRRREVISGIPDGLYSSKEDTILSNLKVKSIIFDSGEGVEVYATALSDGKKGEYIEGVFIYVKN